MCGDSVTQKRICCDILGDILLSFFIFFLVVLFQAISGHVASPFTNAHMRMYTQTLLCVKYHPALQTVLSNKLIDTACSAL
jgi:hypothetical protein